MKALFYSIIGVVGLLAIINLAISIIEKISAATFISIAIICALFFLLWSE